MSIKAVNNAEPLPVSATTSRNIIYYFIY